MSHSKKYPCRCLTRVKGVKCTQRKSLRMLPKHYADGKQPKCPQCGQRHWYVETYRMKHEMGRKPVCYCSGLHFPHRQGTRYCYSHPDAEKDHSGRYE